MPARVLDPFDDTPLECAIAYASCGIRTLPIKPGEKRPPMQAWQDAATTDRNTITNWFRGLYEGHGVGLAMGRQPDGRILFAVDVDEHDPARSGSETLHDLERQHGKLPDTVRAITGAGGTHLLFTAPVEIRNGNIGDGVDIRGHGGQIVVFPSVHPTTKKRYEWEAGYAPWEHEIAEAPAWLIALTTPPDAPGSPPRPETPSGGINTPADHLRASWDWCSELTKAGWTLHHTDRNSDTHWTRPGKDRREGSSAVLHPPNGPFVVWSTDPALAPLWRLGTSAGGSGVSVTPLDFYAHTAHQGDISAAARAIRGDMPVVDLPLAPSGRVDPNTGEILTPARNLPDDFWNARPELDFIRQAAHSRSRSADAVFLFTLARLAATIPPQIQLPPIVGGAASLNFLGAVIGTSGSGKSTAGDVARELAPINRTDVVADIPLGSGEGLAEQYFEWVSEEQADGKRKQVKRQTKIGLYMYLDEGQALGEMGNRKGATLLPTLRSAWSGATIGNTNASAETRRIVPAHSYRLALMVGFQAEHAHALLDDAAGGTPQRFVFAAATDPNIPDQQPDWPGQLDMSPPSIFGEQHIVVAETIKQEIRAHNLAATRGQIVTDDLDAHTNLVRLKVAALIGYLDNRNDVNPDDWELAGIVMETSRAVRQWVIDIARQRALADEMASHRRAARREEIVTDHVTQHALSGASKAIARRVHRSNGDPVQRQHLSQAIAGKHRKIITVDDAIAEAERLHWIVPSDAGWLPGEAKPT